MARALTQDESARYPWASRINDYVPVGAQRRWGVLLAWGGLTVALLVWLLVYVVMSRNVPDKSVHLSPVAYDLVAAAAVASMAGAVLGLITLAVAIIKNAGTAMVWSAAAIVPALLWIALLAR